MANTFEQTLANNYEDSRIDYRFNEFTAFLHPEFLSDIYDELETLIKPELLTMRTKTDLTVLVYRHVGKMIEDKCTEEVENDIRWALQDWAQENEVYNEEDDVWESIVDEPNEKDWDECYTVFGCQYDTNRYPMLRMYSDVRDCYYGWGLEKDEEFTDDVYDRIFRFELNDIRVIENDIRRKAYKWFMDTFWNSLTDDVTAIRK